MLNQTVFIPQYINLTKVRLSIIALLSFSIFFLCLVNVNEVSASDPTLLKEIDVENGGFRDLRWGRHISDCTDMVYETHKQTSGGNVKIYKRSNDRLVLDNKINLSKIEYGFLNSKLLFIALKTSGQDNIFKETVLLRFGDNNKNEQAGNLFWVTKETNVIFQPNGSSKDSVLMLVSKEGLTTKFNK